MRKLSLLMLVILSGLLMLGCSEEQQVAEQPEATAEEQIEEQIEEPQSSVLPQAPVEPQEPVRIVESKPLPAVTIVEETVVQPTLVRECGELGAGSYVLAVDVLAVGRDLYTPCLTLSSDTTLDCGGHRIYKDGVDEGQGVGIKAVNVHDIAIRNCRVESFRDGIDISNARNVRVAFNHVSGQNRDGIRIFDGSEIWVHNNTLRGNSQAGFFLNTSMTQRSWAPDVFFDGNDACGNLERDYKCIGNFKVSGSENYFERVMECRDSNAWPVQDKEYIACHNRYSLRQPGWN